MIRFLFLLVALSCSAQPFTINGWQFHDRDIPKLSEAIRKAPEYGVNLFIFSHSLFDHVQAFFDSPERQRDVLHLGALAGRQKIPWYLWVHEFDDIPARLRVARRVAQDDPRAAPSAVSSSFRLGSVVNMDDPALLDYLRERYERLLAMCPTAAGLVLTLHESDNKLFRNSEVQSKLAVAERIYVIAKLVYDVAKKHNKQLILRNFFYEPREMDYFKEAIARLPDDSLHPALLAARPGAGHGRRRGPRARDR